LDNIFNDIEDFLTDESFRNWVNSPTPELDAHWEVWLAANPTKVELVNQSKKIIQSLNFKTFQPNSVAKAHILQKVRYATKPKSTYRLFLTAWYKVAAILIVALGIGALLRYGSAGTQQEDPIAAVSSNWVQNSNPSGVKSKYILPDGSTVFLNAASSIEYPKAFGTDARVVKLQGEAFFQVVKDADRPFRVLSQEFEVEVLGTTFNVNANLPSPEVALVEGKVKVQVTAGPLGSSLELAPGQMAVFDKEQDALTFTTFDADYVTGWKDGYLMFRDATLNEVVEKLHAYYGIDIAMENESKPGEWSYTGNFKNESLANVMSSMSILRNFDYVIKNDSLIISF
jgi:ferric-dicitrate binding protein FerR (iron transport regulator)